MWLRDTGILDKLKYDVMNPPIPILEPTMRHNQPLIVRQLAIIMIIVVFGLAIGTIVFFVEICIRSKSKQSPESTDGTKPKAIVERHDNIIRPSAASSPVIVV